MGLFYLNHTKLSSKAGEKTGFSIHHWAKPLGEAVGRSRQLTGYLRIYKTMAKEVSARLRDAGRAEKLSAAFEGPSGMRPFEGGQVSGLAFSPFLCRIKPRAGPGRGKAFWPPPSPQPWARACRKAGIPGPGPPIYIRPSCGRAEAPPVPRRYSR